MVTVSPDSLHRLDAVARAAGAAILAHYHTSVAVELKDDKTPLTAADRAAHEVIVAALGDWDRAVPVISEEGAIPAYEERRSWRQFWLVDPLDGTKEFLKQNGEFTVNIALVEGDAPVLGVVFAPALALMYQGGHGLGAWKQQGSGPVERIASAPPPDGQPLVVVESRSHPSAELERYLQALTVKTRVQAGSSLKFCWVAEGRADVYPRLGTTMEWDTAAGDCIYRNSGRDGQRRSTLRYNTPSLRNDCFVIGL
jgi:3'(2'), 5'-bisphosphate nucleotidase